MPCTSDLTLSGASDASFSYGDLNAVTASMFFLPPVSSIQPEEKVRCRRIAIFLPSRRNQFFSCLLNRCLFSSSSRLLRARRHWSPVSFLALRRPLSSFPSGTGHIAWHVEARWEALAALREISKPMFRFNFIYSLLDFFTGSGKIAYGKYVMLRRLHHHECKCIN